MSPTCTKLFAQCVQMLRRTMGDQKCVLPKLLLVLVYDSEMKLAGIGFVRQGSVDSRTTTASVYHRHKGRYRFVRQGALKVFLNGSGVPEQKTCRKWNGPKGI